MDSFGRAAWRDGRTDGQARAPALPRAPAAARLTSINNRLLIFPRRNQFFLLLFWPIVPVLISLIAAPPAQLEGPPSPSRFCNGVICFNELVSGVLLVISSSSHPDWSDQYAIDLWMIFTEY